MDEFFQLLMRFRVSFQYAGISRFNDRKGEEGFMPLVSFYTSRKYLKISGFLMFSGGLEKDQWHQMRSRRSFQRIVDWHI